MTDNFRFILQYETITEFERRWFAVFQQQDSFFGFKKHWKVLKTFKNYDTEIKTAIQKCMLHAKTHGGANEFWCHIFTDGKYQSSWTSKEYLDFDSGLIKNPNRHRPELL